MTSDGTSDEASPRQPTLSIEVDAPSGRAKVRSTYEPASRGRTSKQLEGIGEQLTEVGTSTLVDLIVTPALCFADAMAKLPEQSRPATVTMKFSLKAGVEGNLYIAKGTSSGAIEVTTTWNRPKT